MTRHMTASFQVDRPVFVKIPFVGAGKNWTVGQQFKWQAMSMKEETIAQLFYNDYLMHSEEAEQLVESKVIGDGLEELDIEDLNALVKKINEKVLLKVGQTKFIRMKVPSSTIKDKQIGKIRRWRLTYGHLE